MKEGSYNTSDDQLLEKCKSETTSYQPEWPSSKNSQTINAEEGVERREPSYTVDGNVNWYSHYGEQYGGSLKKKNRALKNRATI